MINKHWKQHKVEHCPNNKCKGMLLQSIFEHYEKCSDCDKIFIYNGEYKEIENNSLDIKEEKEKKE